MRSKDRWCVAWGVVLVAGLAAFPGRATAQLRAPSEAEAHSIYCVEVLRAEIKLQQHLISAASEAAGNAEPESRAQWTDTSAELLQQLAKLEATLQRLQVYLLPRIPTIDSLALAAVIRQANVDLEGPWSDEELSGRVRVCENPSWVGQR